MMEQLKGISITTGLQLPEFYLRFVIRNKISDSKPAGTFPLKDYLREKRNAEQALYDFEALHEREKYQL